MRRNEKYTAGTLGHSLSGTASRPCTTAFGSWKASSDSPYGISMANRFWRAATSGQPMMLIGVPPLPDRKSTRLNSSHGYISYAVFCLKKKKRHLKHLGFAVNSCKCTDSQ